MSAQLGNIVFIVWRESVEALLVVGILSAWLASRDVVERTAGRRFLWAGVASGIVGAIVLAVVLTVFDGALSEEASSLFQTVIVLSAAALIVQMVVWMRRHGRTLKRDMETELSAAADRRSWWSIYVLALVAVLREGSETVVFLWGSLAGVTMSTAWGPILAALVGFAAAVASYMVLQLGGRILSWWLFFRVTEVMLLFLAAGLTISGIGGLIDLGWLPSLGRAWNTSAVLSDGGADGGLFSALTGYRARPDIVEVIGYALYWLLVLGLLHGPVRFARPRMA